MKDSPWVLTHVSNRWRAVSLSTPSLWSLIGVDYAEGFAYPLAAIEAHVERAGSLKIHFYPSEYFPIDPQLDMFKFLTMHCLRWEDLNLGVIPAMLPLLAVLHDRVPLLRHLWMQWDADETSVSMDPIDCFINTPSLVKLGVYNFYSLVSIPMPVHQLTEYQLFGSVDMHLRVLKLAENFVQAHIYVSVDESAFHEPLTLPFLRRLYVSNVSFLDSITVPFLEEIGLSVAPDDALGSFRSFIDRSSCIPRRLCVTGYPDSTSTEILLKCPSIVELVVILYDPDANENINTLMSTLVVSPLGGSSRTARVPHLRSIFFGCENEIDIDWTHYIEMLESRWRAPGCTLEAAAVVSVKRPGPNPAALTRLKMLRQDGLDLLLLEGWEASDILGTWVFSQ
ncbi:hypothetical protein DFH07DRAFT_1025818 [Mycena maculata]|uniref:F-box domain-containing protein n=1 Tax=Mycena maculata TaxID=230809 RepID=A0AAD7NYC6_9AGAR|nr:hypothetical protein DFH07DRAFT_1025818 [Mycena maculata]